MKAIINKDSLIINTFDRELQGKPLYGRIIMIDLETRETIKLDGTELSIIDMPMYNFLTELKWDETKDKNELTIFELSSKPKLVSLFEEVSRAWNEYCNAISCYINLYNRFPELEYSRTK